MNKEIPLLLSIAKTNNIIARNLSLGGQDFSDFVILYHLSKAENKKLRRIDLANLLGLTASGITRMLIPLEKIGIINRDFDEADARARYATITKAGETLLCEITESLDIKLDDFFKDTKDAELKKINSFLSDLADNLSQDELNKEAKNRWGESPLYQELEKKMKKLSEKEIEKISAKGELILKQISRVKIFGADSKEVQELINKHYSYLRNFYEPNIKMYRGLGKLYVEDERFNAYFEKISKDLAKFMSQAIEIYCDNN